MVIDFYLKVFLLKNATPYYIVFEIIVFITHFSQLK